MSKNSNGTAEDESNNEIDLRTDDYVVATVGPYDYCDITGMTFKADRYGNVLKALLYDPETETVAYASRRADAKVKIDKNKSARSHNLRNPAWEIIERGELVITATESDDERYDEWADEDPEEVLWHVKECLTGSGPSASKVNNISKTMIAFRDVYEGCNYSVEYELVNDGDKQ